MNTTLRQPRILVLDDDAFQLAVLSDLLRGLGFDRVSTCDNARQALDDLDAEVEPSDVVVCDLNMPGMDGLEFLRVLAARGFNGSAILLSGEDARILHTVSGLLDGAAIPLLGTLEKPARREDMQALMARWVPTRPAAPRLLPAFAADEIRAATRNSQWVLHYQPKVDLRTGELAGVEALVRWNHPQHGLVPPVHFIGVAEECGAIDALTDWVLGESIRQLAEWQGRGLRLQMAVNVSMGNLCAPDFARRLLGLAEAASVAADDLTLELTESCVMSPSLAPLECLARLRMQGFRLSIDDFGTGHSSFAQLRDVPFTELKVDRGFVHAARANPITRPILEASIALARRLGMQSVAEGVETDDDWRLLGELGCDLAQGYFIAHPMPAGALVAWQAAWMSRRAGGPGHEPTSTPPVLRPGESDVSP